MQAYEFNVYYNPTSTIMTWKIHCFYGNSKCQIWSCEFVPVVAETKMFVNDYELYSKTVELVYDTKRFNADEMYAFTKSLKSNQSGSFAVINYNFEIIYDHIQHILSITQKDNYTSTISFPLSESERCQFANQFDRVPIIVNEIRSD